VTITDFVAPGTTAVGTLSGNEITIPKGTTIGSGSNSAGPLDTDVVLTISEDFNTITASPFAIAGWVNVSSYSAEKQVKNEVPSEPEQTLDINGDWKANCPVLDNRSLEDVNADVEFSNLVCVDDMAYLKQNLNNFGAAIDLGAEFRLLNNHLKLSAAVTDLGIIKWAATSHLGGSASATYEFAGVNVSTDGVNTDNILGGEGINKDNIINKGKYNGYAERLAYSINVGAEYNMLKNMIAFGIFSQTKFYKTAPYSELTASVNLRPTSWLSATVSHTVAVSKNPFNGNNMGVFGAAINFHPAMINFYLGIDFIDTNYVSLGNVKGIDLLFPRNAQSLNLYMGMAFNFGRPKHLKNNGDQSPRWK
jgi:hypothetical protein